MKFTNKRFSAAAALAASLAASPLANALTETANFDVLLVIEGACTITAEELNFGSNSGSIDSNIDAESSLAVSCTNGTDYTISLDDGQGAGATTASRKMTNADDSSTVDYSLYQEAARTTVWGAGAAAVTGIGDGAEQTIPVFGRVDSGQTDVTVGTYQDNIIATIEF